MQTDIVYEEKIFSKWTAGIFAFVIAGFLFLLVYQILVGPIGSRPAPNWFFLFMILLFVVTVINFSRLAIRISPQFISVSYGMFEHKISFENVEKCYLDKTPAIQYWGWGIRIARIKGKWRLVYNVPRGPRVVLSMRKGRFKEFVFSTKNPAEVMKIIRARKAKPVGA